MEKNGVLTDWPLGIYKFAQEDKNIIAGQTREIENVRYGEASLANRLKKVP